MNADENAEKKPDGSAEPKRPKLSSPKRKLTPFLAHEMLYEYATDQLDRERRAAVDEFIQTDKESQTILDGIKRSLEYSSQLSQIQIAPAVLEHLRESENIVSLGKRYTSWREWPESLRWSLIAIIVSSTVAGLVAIVPWNRWSGFRTKPGDTIEIAKITSPTSENEIAAGEEVPESTEVAENPPDEGSGDDIPDSPVKVDPSSQAPTQVVAQPMQQVPPVQVAANNAPSARDQVNAASGNAKLPVAPDKPTQGQANQVANTAVPGDEPAGHNEKKEPKPKGFVYRAFMTLGDLETIGPMIADQIKELGGEKAGEVELGWKRGTGRYYHFSMPGSNEKQLLEKLQAYGPVRISKDPHPRIMPDGQVRFILWIESAN